jgi:hypothetical protein
MIKLKMRVGGVNETVRLDSEQDYETSFSQTLFEPVLSTFRTD